MFPILLLSSSVHSLSPELSCLISSSSSFIVSIVLCPFVCPPFHCFQFLSSFPQYSSSYYLSDHPNSFFAVNCPGSSPLLNVPSSLFCCLTSSMSHWYSFLYSLTASFAFSRFSLSSQVSDSAMNPFHHTKYLSFPHIRHLFRILSTSHSSSSSITTGAGCSFLCPSTCPTYLHILLTLTTGCIFTILGSSNSTVFDDMIFFIL